MTTRELADDKTSYSTTRYAFIAVIKYDIAMITLTILIYAVSHFIKRPLDASFFYGVSTLLGILTALVTGGKILQGFENKNAVEDVQNKIEEHIEKEIKNDEETIDEDLLQ